MRHSVSEIKSRDHTLSIKKRCSGDTSLLFFLDIDECANGTHSCDVNAVCNNTRGSYNCTCKDEFHGDGINCTGINTVGNMC